MIPIGRSVSASTGRCSSTTREPLFLKMEETVLLALVAATAKHTSVGGTSSSLKEPDMLSFPPMAGTLKCSCAVSAPSKAAAGLPQRSG